MMGGSHFSHSSGVSHDSSGGHPPHSFFGMGGHMPPPPPSSPLKSFPRGPQGHFLPVPHGGNNTAQVHVQDFQAQNWHGGHWEHRHHHHDHDFDDDDDFGWFWVVGDDWFYYPEPVYPYPDPYTPPGEEPGWWYWCAAAQEYYPYVTDCPSGWVPVEPQD